MVDGPSMKKACRNGAKCVLRGIGAAVLIALLIGLAVGLMF